MLHLSIVTVFVVEIMTQQIIELNAVPLQVRCIPPR